MGAKILVDFVLSYARNKHITHVERIHVVSHIWREKVICAYSRSCYEHTVMTYGNGVARYLVTQSATLRVSVFVCLCVCVSLCLRLCLLFTAAGTAVYLL